MTTWEQLKKEYVDSRDTMEPPIREEDLTTPELVGKYIEEWGLSPEAELKLLTTPELVEKYIKKWCLSSEAELKLLTTPELVGKYIEEWGLSDGIRGLINKKNETIKTNINKKTD